MRVIHSSASLLHDPESYFRRGRTVPHPEQASRYTILRDAAAGAGHTLIEAPDRGAAPILAIHDRGYVELLSTIWDRRDELPGIGEEILTGHFARPQMARRPSGLLGLLGFHMADTSTAIRAGTWQAIRGSAQAAIGAADAALEHGAAYGLARPPGHHAYADSAGGFCFLNNTAIAAERLRRALAGGAKGSDKGDDKGGRVAILDIDVHHGNGTQGIFWRRGDVFTVSVHADPSNYFPFYAGYADETGQGEGAGLNRNIALAEGSGDEAWLGAIEEGLGAIAKFRPDALVVALGFDASADDPIGAFRVSTSGFARAAGLLAKAHPVTALIQEGGYLCDALPRNLATFLGAFEAARR